MKIALIQLHASDDKINNLNKARSFVKEAASQGARWILLPEVFSFRGNLLNKDVLKTIPESIPGPITEEFQALASAQRTHLLLGSLLERAEGSKAYNTSVAIDTHGKIQAKYQKIHLFDAIVNDKIIREGDFFLNGSSEQIVAVEEFKVGLSICYDLRFPDLYQQYLHQGAHILTVPSCFTKQTGIPHWESLLRARAIETLSYVVAPNQVGKDAKGIEAHGHSMVISPWGEIIARGSATEEEIIYAEVSMDPIREARKKLPGIAKD